MTIERVVTTAQANAALRDLPAPSEADVVAFTAACWAEPEREYQYAACDYAIRLFAYCARRADDREFFVRNAIGWALREYSKTDAAAVLHFVASHTELSPLSAREALKWVARQERV